MLWRNTIAQVWVAVLLATTGVLACQYTTENRWLPPGAVAMDPPAIYEQWWAQIEACAGRHMDFQSIRWYVVPQSTIFAYGNDTNVQGLWLPQGNRIILAGLLAQDSLLVRHEELHAVLQSGDHDPVYFQQRCGTIVAQ